VAVMRRDSEKAKDYSKRHNVSKWYDDAYRLINDPGVNAIYVATPPSTHEEYTIGAINAGKPVYVEKPMSVNVSSATNMMIAAQEKNIKLSVSHYRREQPLFRKIKELLDEKAIGEVRVINLLYHKRPLTGAELSNPRIAWRVSTDIAGGGLFNDLAPHQLDLMIYFFGQAEKVSGMATNQAHLYSADDVVAGNILFSNGVLFSGSWCFTTNEMNETDKCEIIGSKGKISFSVFDNREISVTINEKIEIIPFDKLAHVQQPMIQKVVEYFLGESSNPCSGKDGVEVMRLIDIFTGQ
ncbi:MAG: Gfo/Idh/MocA family oxidoreductase, partial [Ginsengibacter sp.]